VGYYTTFLTGAIVTVGARSSRRCLRRHFQKSKWTAMIYDVMTFVAAKVALIYTTFPFVTMHLNPGWLIYKRLYFFVHILALFGILVLPKVLRPSSHKSSKGADASGSTSTRLDEATAKVN